MRRTGSWTLLTGGMLLVAGCGGGDDAADNAANMTMNTSGGMMLGNDASAMEVVANQGSAVTPLPANGSAPANGSRSQAAPAPAPAATRTPTPAPAPIPPASDRSTPPGGDRGGNSSDSNSPGT